MVDVEVVDAKACEGKSSLEGCGIFRELYSILKNALPMRSHTLPLDKRID